VSEFMALVNDFTALVNDITSLDGGVTALVNDESSLDGGFTALVNDESSLDGGFTALVNDGEALPIALLVALSILLLSLQEQQPKPVFICTGAYSATYHLTDTCRGLALCTKSVITLTVEEAQTQHGRRRCGYEYK